MNLTTIETVNQMLRNVQTGQMSRRQMLRGLSALGIAGAGLAALGRHSAFARQEGSPPAAATPAVGAQADGSTLWRVKVGDMRWTLRSSCTHSSRARSRSRSAIRSGSISARCRCSTR